MVLSWKCAVLLVLDKFDCKINVFFRNYASSARNSPNKFAQKFAFCAESPISSLRRVPVKNRVTRSHGQVTDLFQSDQKHQIKGTEGCCFVKLLKDQLEPRIVFPNDESDEVKYIIQLSSIIKIRKSIHVII